MPEAGRALASDKDFDTLPALILRHARHLTHSDGASIYRRDGNGRLYFRLWQNASSPGPTEAQKMLAGEAANALFLARGPRLDSGMESRAMQQGCCAYGFGPIGEDSVAGYVARTGAPVVPDGAYTVGADAPYRFNPAPGRPMGYCTRSMLTVALKNKADDVVGVLQLINRKDHPTGC